MLLSPRLNAVNCVSCERGVMSTMLLPNRCVPRDNFVSCVSWARGVISLISLSPKYNSVSRVSCVRGAIPFDFIIH